MNIDIPENHCPEFTRVQILEAISYGPHVSIPISLLLTLHLGGSKDKYDRAFTSTLCAEKCKVGEAHRRSTRFGIYIAAIY